MNTCLVNKTRATEEVICILPHKQHKIVRRHNVAYVCRICMSHMYVAYVCRICMSHMCFQYSNKLRHNFKIFAEGEVIIGEYPPRQI